MAAPDWLWSARDQVWSITDQGWSILDQAWSTADQILLPVDPSPSMANQAWSLVDPIGPIKAARSQAATARTALCRLSSSTISRTFSYSVNGIRTSASLVRACAASLAACGKSLSQQAYAILKKIKAVDAVLQRNPELAERVLEVHPELSFSVWAGGRPMRHPKLSGFGFVERLELVRSVFGRAAEEVREAVPRTEAGDDDILDAFAALWTARRIHSGEAVRLPAGEERDECGLRMQMFA